MCIEDIRIGRQSPSQSTFWSRATGVGAQVIGPRKFRTRLAVSTDGAGAVQVYIGSSINGLPVAVIGPGSSPVVLRIEDYGIDITGPVFINNPSAVTVTGTVTDVWYPYDIGPKHGFSEQTGL